MASDDLVGVLVLVVEDHADLREVLRAWLERDGAVVNEACNGQEALQALLTRPRPDVIVCDLHMPGMDGCAFLARMREKAGFGHVPVIALTGSVSNGAVMRTLEAGFQAHLTKPVSGAALRTQIVRILGR